MNARETTLADDWRGHTTVELRVVGKRPKNPPYLRITELESGRLIASVDNANALRALAKRILRALGDKPRG